LGLEQTEIPRFACLYDDARCFFHNLFRLWVFDSLVTLENPEAEACATRNHCGIAILPASHVESPVGKQ
jgi:hypothetical protein